MRERIRGVPINDLKQDIVFFFKLSTCTFIPFIAPFPELCIKVGQHWQKEERVIRDIQGNVIMDFNLEVIKRAF